jgi:hypothetical protein
VGQENTRNELAAARRQREASFAAKQDRVAAYGKAGRHPHAAKQGVNPLMGFILFLYEMSCSSYCFFMRGLLLQKLEAILMRMRHAGFTIVSRYKVGGR